MPFVTSMKRAGVLSFPLLYSFTAQARYMIMATFTTSNTWSWNPPIMTDLQASLIFTGRMNSTGLWMARISRSPIERA